jgi:hypothetical protein
MKEYRIFVVSTVKIKSGKTKEAVKWWKEKGKALFELTPGTKSVRAYAVQFGLGGEYTIEIWAERENYASFDLEDKDYIQNPQKYSAFKEAQELFDGGPTRIMGDWPESMVIFE